MHKLRVVNLDSSEVTGLLAFVMLKYNISEFQFTEEESMLAEEMFPLLEVQLEEDDGPMLIKFAVDKEAM